jgi:hypothetical protein
MRLAGVDIAAEEERRRMLEMLQQQQNNINLVNQGNEYGIAFEGVDEQPLEGATDWIGDGAADLADKLGLPQESLIALGLLTRNGRVTQRGFKALIQRASKPRIKLKNNTTTNTVKPKIKLKNNVKEQPTYKSIMNSGTSPEAKTTMLKNLMTNMKNNKGSWGTGAVIAGGVANNQLSSVDGGEPDISFVDEEVNKQPNVIPRVHDVNYRTKLAEQYWLIHSTQGEEAAKIFIGELAKDNPDVINAVMDDNSPFVSPKLASGNTDFTATRPTNIGPLNEKGIFQESDPIKTLKNLQSGKKLSWMDRLMQGVPGGSGGWDNPLYRIGELMREMDAPGSWGLDGRASGRWSKSAEAHAAAQAAAAKASGSTADYWKNVNASEMNETTLLKLFTPESGGLFSHNETQAAQIGASRTAAYKSMRAQLIAQKKLPTHQDVMNALSVKYKDAQNK